MTVIGEVRTWAVAALVAFSVGSAQADDSQVQRGALSRQYDRCLWQPPYAQGSRRTRPPRPSAFRRNPPPPPPPPVFHAVVPNITPDNWSIPASAYGPTSRSPTPFAMASGRMARRIGPPMPIGFYRNMSDSMCSPSSPTFAR